MLRLQLRPLLWFFALLLLLYLLVLIHLLDLPTEEDQIVARTHRMQPRRPHPRPWQSDTTSRNAPSARAWPMWGTWPSTTSNTEVQTSTSFTTEESQTPHNQETTHVVSSASTPDFASSYSSSIVSDSYGASNIAPTSLKTLTTTLTDSNDEGSSLHTTSAPLSTIDSISTVDFPDSQYNGPLISSTAATVSSSVYWTISSGPSIRSTSSFVSAPSLPDISPTIDSGSQLPLSTLSMVSVTTYSTCDALASADDDCVPTLESSSSPSLLNSTTFATVLTISPTLSSTRRVTQHPNTTTSEQSFDPSASESEGTSFTAVGFSSLVSNTVESSVQGSTDRNNTQTVNSNTIPFVSGQATTPSNIPSDTGAASGTAAAGGQTSISRLQSNEPVSTGTVTGQITENLSTETLVASNLQSTTLVIFSLSRISEYSTLTALSALTTTIGSTTTVLTLAPGGAVWQCLNCDSLSGYPSATTPIGTVNLETSPRNTMSPAPTGPAVTSSIALQVARSSASALVSEFGSLSSVVASYTANPSDRVLSSSAVAAIQSAQAHNKAFDDTLEAAGAGAIVCALFCGAASTAGTGLAAAGSALEAGDIAALGAALGVIAGASTAFSDSGPNPSLSMDESSSTASSSSTSETSTTPSATCAFCPGCVDQSSVEEPADDTGETDQEYRRSTEVLVMNPVVRRATRGPSLCGTKAFVRAPEYEGFHTNGKDNNYSPWFNYAPVGTCATLRSSLVKDKKGNFGSTVLAGDEYDTEHIFEIKQIMMFLNFTIQRLPELAEYRSESFDANSPFCKDRDNPFLAKDWSELYKSKRPLQAFHDELERAPEEFVYLERRTNNMKGELFGNQTLAPAKKQTKVTYDTAMQSMVRFMRLEAVREYLQDQLVQRIYRQISDRIKKAFVNFGIECGLAASGTKARGLSCIDWGKEYDYWESKYLSDVGEQMSLSASGFYEYSSEYLTGNKTRTETRIQDLENTIHQSKDSGSPYAKEEDDLRKQKDMLKQVKDLIRDLEYYWAPGGPPYEAVELSGLRRPADTGTAMKRQEPPARVCLLPSSDSSETNSLTDQPSSTDIVTTAPSTNQQPGTGTTTTTSQISDTVATTSGIRLTSSRIECPTTMPSCNAADCKGTVTPGSDNKVAECQGTLTGCHCQPDGSTPGFDCGQQQSCQLNGCNGSVEKVNGQNVATCRDNFRGCSCIPDISTPGFECGEPRSCEENGCDGLITPPSQLAFCNNRFAGCSCLASSRTPGYCTERTMLQCSICNGDNNDICRGLKAGCPCKPDPVTSSVSATTSEAPPPASTSPAAPECDDGKTACGTLYVGDYESVATREIWLEGEVLTAVIRSSDVSPCVRADRLSTGPLMENGYCDQFFTCPHCTISGFKMTNCLPGWTGPAGTKVADMVTSDGDVVGSCVKMVGDEENLEWVDGSCVFGYKTRFKPIVQCRSVRFS